MYEWFAGYGDHKDANVRTMAGRVIERIKHLGSFNDAIDIDLSDGHVVFRDVKDALFFQKCQMLASTEDWKDIINRVREHLYIQDAKYMKIARLLPDMHQVDNGITLHPTGYMYYVDSDVVNGQIKADEEDDMFLHATGNLRKSISREERERFVRHKLRRYAEFLLDDDAVDYPNEMLNGNVVKFGLPSSSVEIIDRVDVPPDSILTNSAARLASTELQSAEGVTYILDPLKNRVVRPYVKTLQGKDYIDKIKSRYGIVSATLFEQHQRLQWQQLTVRLVVTREYASVLRRSFEENNVRYEELKKMPRMSKDQLRRMIIRAGLRGEGVAIETGQLVRAS
jgi:hypothetical protein